MQQLEVKLSMRERQGNLRTLTTPGLLIDFSSNDYLGLAKSQILMKLIAYELHHQKMIQNGSTGSRLLTGNSAYAERLEDKIAAFHGFEAALLFNCGYMANLGLIAAIADREDTVLYDRQVHASTHDGIALCKGMAVPFRHNDLDHLKQRLQKVSRRGSTYICVESIYSTDGSIAPLCEIGNLAGKYGARLIIDEAHAIGVAGPQGRGLTAAADMGSHVFAVIATFGKALGVHGAAILGSSQLKRYLINFCRPCIYTTAMPLHSMCSIKCSYDLFPKLDAERLQLKALMRSFPQAQSQIQTIKISGNAAVRHVSERLEGNGFDVRPLMSPTVKRGQEVLRICLHAYNTPHQARGLLDAIAQIESEQ